jgi:hypothetical protein
MSRLWLPLSVACGRDYQMTPAGFEPGQPALVELDSTPLDHSGKKFLSRWRAGQVIHMRHASIPTSPPHFERTLPIRRR